MADDLITPELKKPKGLAPKYLIIYIVGGLMVLTFALWAFGRSGSKPSSAEAVARDKQQTLSPAEQDRVGKDAQQVLSSAPAASELPASLKVKDDGAPRAGAAPGGAVTSTSYSPPPGAPGSQPPLPNGTKLPDAGKAVPPAAVPAAPTVPAVDPAAAARDVEVMNSKMTVFDIESGSTKAAGAGAAAATGQLADIDREIAAAKAAIASAQNPAQAAADARRDAEAMTSRIASEQQRQAAQQGPASGRDAQFLKDFTDQRAQPALRPVPMESPRTVFEGTVIPAVLSRDLMSDLPGVITASVTRDIYDSLTSRQKLICKGSRLVGRYSNEVQAGQSRLLFAFTRLILPNGASFDLAGFSGSDEAGRAGVTGDVDHHYARIFGASLLIGLLADRVTRQSVVPQGQVVAQRSATGQIMVDTATGLLDKYKATPTTISIEKGTPINVEVRRDMLIPPSSGC